MIKKNRCFTNLELEDIKCRVLKDNACDTEGEDTVDHDIGESCREENLDAPSIEYGCVFEEVEEIDKNVRDMIEGMNRFTSKGLSRKSFGSKKIDMSFLKEKVSKVNKVPCKIRAESLSGTNTLIKACSIFILVERLDLNLFKRDKV